MAERQKSGILTICGRPNVGKSTLTNAFVGEKVAIVTNKPQTTRNRICAILNRGCCQFVFVDTPGLHRPRTRLGDYMVDVVKQSVSGVDGILLLVEPIPNIGPPEEQLIARIREENCPAVLVINKIDALERKEDLLAVIETYRKAYPFQAVVPLSARTGEGVEELLALLEDWLPEGPPLFPEGMVSDQPERQMMAEILREKLLLCLEEEIPHGAAVEITRFIERDDEVIECDAAIYCEKNSHKGIIIGKGGKMLKKISSLARTDMERFMGTKIYLQTWVKVKERWRDNVNLIRDFGYREE
ncbi:MAG: GTPase Era [Oscillospiraceae bacterium]|jgi:GTP-binding protein Era|nr:GTPase Era [Oscillospiraceae bacterium]MCI9393441.1 GTPase Era [Oscillospiraceae bacterium]MCI9580444.1 GTPase Era [Oscillospiraceae bacterium]